MWSAATAFPARSRRQGRTPVPHRTGRQAASDPLPARPRHAVGQDRRRADGSAPVRCSRPGDQPRLEHAGQRTRRSSTCAWLHRRARDEPAPVAVRQGLQRLYRRRWRPSTRGGRCRLDAGEIQASDEHAYTEQVQNVLRRAIGALGPGGGRPRVLLSTLPGEEHILGLLMVEATLASEGAACLSLGTRTPLVDLVPGGHGQRLRRGRRVVQRCLIRPARPSTACRSSAPCCHRRSPCGPAAPRCAASRNACPACGWSPTSTTPLQALAEWRTAHGPAPALKAGSARLHQPSTFTASGQPHPLRKAIVSTLLGLVAAHSPPIPRRRPVFRRQHRVPRRARYMGRWYEISCYPTWFQKSAGTALAEYALKGQRRGGGDQPLPPRNGEMNVATAVGRCARWVAPCSARLKVRLRPGWLSFLPMVGGLLGGGHRPGVQPGGCQRAVAGIPVGALPHAAGGCGALRGAARPPAEQGFDLSRLITTKQVD